MDWAARGSAVAAMAVQGSVARPASLASPAAMDWAVVASEAEAMPLARQVVAMDWAARGSAVAAMAVQGSVARPASLASPAAMDWAAAAMVLAALD